MRGRCCSSLTLLVSEKERPLKTERETECPVFSHNCSSFAWTHFQSGIPLKQASFACHCPGPLKHSMRFVSCSRVRSAVRVDVFCDSFQQQQVTMPMYSHIEVDGDATFATTPLSAEELGTCAASRLRSDAETVCTRVSTRAH